MLWKRKIEIVVSRGDVIIHRFSDLAMSIRFTAQGFGETADTCNITIYNLAQETVKSLASGGLTVKVFAGYESDRNKEGKLPLLVGGDVVNVFGTKRVPHHVTEILCVPTNITQMFKARMTYKTGAKETLPELIDNLIRKAIKENEELFHDGDLRPVPTFNMLSGEQKTKTLSNYTFSGGTLGEIIIEACKQLGVSASFTGRTINFYTILVKEDTTEVQETRYKNSASAWAFDIYPNLVRGSPEASIAKVKIPYVFDPNLRCGSIINVQQLLKINGFRGAQASELQTGGIFTINLPDNDRRIQDLSKYMHYSRYQVYHLQHILETHGAEWTTIIQGVAFNDGTTLEVFL